MPDPDDLRRFCEHQLNNPAPPLPQHVVRLIEEPVGLKPVELAQCDKILLSPALQHQTGYASFGKGRWYVAVKTPMPNVTRDMINWWFWWHVQDSIRYRMWYPQCHYSNEYDRRYESYFTRPFQSFQPNVQYPVESIGRMKTRLFIHFVTPQQFGYSDAAIRSSHVETIVCAHVGLQSPRIQHTEMSHMFFKDPAGLVLVSRFWLGHKIHFVNYSDGFVLNRLLRNRFIKPRLIAEEQARAMVEHCYTEYSNLATFLPELYRRFSGHGI